MKAGRGFTLVEVLVSGAIAMIALFATLNLAVNAARGNTERRDAQVAGQLAEHVLATIQADATQWVGDTPPGYLTYLNKLQLPATPGTGTAWLNGPGSPLSADKRVGALGADQKYDQGALQEVPTDRGQRFCVHFRLTWVSAEVVRADVRVSWARSKAAADLYKLCPSDMIYDVGYVGSVSLPALIMRNVYVQ